MTGIMITALGMLGVFDVALMLICLWADKPDEEEELRELEEFIRFEKNNKVKRE